MLIFGDTLLNMPIMSLQTGHEIARTESAVIDPSDLTVVAYYVSGPSLDFEPALLRTADIREIGELGAIVNSSDELVEPEDLVKFKNIIELEFELEEMPVVDDHRHKLGKVIRYTLDPETFTIHQLHIRRPLFKSFSESELLINRRQIIEISPTKIVVKAPDLKSSAKVPVGPRPVNNPFRQPQPKTEAIDQQET